MRKFAFAGILVLVFMGGVFMAGNLTSAQIAPPTPPPLAGPAGIQADPLSPDALTSFTVSNPYCYQPDPAVDKCSINFRFIQTTDNQSSAPYMTWLAITISGKRRYNATAFFEGTITYSYDMVPDGLTVACGAPNAGGAGNLFGNVYGVTIQPLDSSRNPMSTDIANVTCPAFNP
ncbi:MAG: hypothetical protein R3D55_05265 [Chloroflexota bacterium]